MLLLLSRKCRKIATRCPRNIAPKDEERSRGVGAAVEKESECVIATDRPANVRYLIAPDSRLPLRVIIVATDVRACSRAEISQEQRAARTRPCLFALSFVSRRVRSTCGCHLLLSRLEKPFTVLRIYVLCVHMCIQTRSRRVTACRSYKVREILGSGV